MDMRHCYVWTVILSLFLMAGCGVKTTRGTAKDAEVARTLVATAETVLARHLDDKGGDVLKKLLREAKGIMIIPSAGEFGFMLSFSGGNGVLMANTGKGWSGPVVMTRSSVGWGWQAGASSQSGIVLFMHEEDFRYVLETGFVFKGQARLVFLSTDYEYGESPEFREAGDIYFVGNRTGLFAGVAFDTGGYVNRPALNEVLSGVAGGDPVDVLYGMKARPKSGEGLRELIGSAALAGVLIKEKDGTEVPSN